MGRLKLALVAFVVIGAGAATGLVQDVCGPFTDVSPALCPYVLEMYYLGITAGTSPTTYSPEATVTRGQAAVLSRRESTRRSPAPPDARRSGNGGRHRSRPG